MKIGVDIDNVISNTFLDLANYFNEFMGKSAESKDVVEVMRKEKLKMLAYWLITWKDKLLTKVSPIEESADLIKKWHKDHEIVLVTSRISIFNKQTKDWLKKHGIPYHELHHAKEKTKHKKAKGCRIFIEDNIDECEVLADYCEKVFLIDYPWNRRKHDKKNIVRVKGFKDISAHIDM